MGGLAKKLIASAGSEEKLYVDDVLSVYLRTGTGADTTVTTNIDMTKGYMLWTKGRSGATDHAIYDSARGVTLDLASNTTDAQTTQSTGLKSVSATGYTIGSLAKMNTSGATYVDYVFRRAPKFFDVVTYTTVAGAMTIPHSLGQEVGMWVIKATNAVDSWWVHHRSIPTSLLRLNGTSAVEPSFSTATSTNITISNGVFAAGTQIVIYLFAHDDSADGIIQCGSVTSDSNRDVAVTLGWEPQWVLFKRTNNVGDWNITDSMRGLLAAITGTDQPAARTLLANTSAAESAAEALGVNATGFREGRLGTAGDTYIYMAIRRPNKPPTSGTQVFSPLLTANGSVGTTGFPIDSQWSAVRAGAGGFPLVQDRLRGVSTTNSAASTLTVTTSSTAAETSANLGSQAWDNLGFTSVNSGTIYWNFRRAPGFFDVVCYTGTGTFTTPFSHNLTVSPELVIVKARTATGQMNWYVGHYGLNQYATSISTAEVNNTSLSTNAPVTATTFVPILDATGVSYVAYLFASLPGISRVGSYTGNGTTQTINCGFTTGARFVLIKRTDSTGDWYVWDTARGIVAADDPHLSLNTTAAEVTTDDSVDPESSGFIVNQNTATNINVNGGSYIFLAIA